MKHNPFKLLCTGLLFAALLSAAPQEKEETPEKEALKPTAEEILKKAAEAQGGRELIEEGLKNFKARFESTFHHPEKGKVNYSVTRIFQDPSLLWTEKKHDLHKKATLEVYNGMDGWFVDGKGHVSVYTDKPATFKTDIKNLKEDVRITKQMFKFFFIANLHKELTDLTRLHDKPIPFSDKDDPFYVIAGMASGWIGEKEKRTVYLHIYVDPKKHRVRAVSMEDLSLDGKDRIFLFDKYLKNRQGVMVPAKITMYVDDNSSGIPDMKIQLVGVEGEDGKPYLHIDFNIDLDADLFNLPKEKEEE